MKFIKKTENFFYQLQYCLAIVPEPILEGKKGLYSLSLKPDIFFKLISDFHIDYPFHSENKIIELKALKDKENINSSDAFKIIENYKNQYWLLDSVVMFEPVKNKLRNVLKSIDAGISETELNKELNNFQKYLQTERESIYNDLINELKVLPPQQTTTESNTIKYTAKHYVLGYLIECNAKGESFPIGQKKELEKIGNEKMGTGKGNRFYKVFNEIVNKDLNIESNLVEIGGEKWRTIVKDLSNEPETIEKYLQSKQL